MLAEVARRAGLVPGFPDLPVLDIGCGPGHISRFLAELGVRVVGVDISPGMVDEARRRNPDIEFREAAMQSLPCADGSVAAMVAPYSLIHIPRDSVIGVLREFRRVLVPGGSVLLSFHIGKEVRHSEEWWGQPVDLDFVFFEVLEMEGYLREVGFGQIETHERDPYPDVEVQTQRAYAWARH